MAVRRKQFDAVVCMYHDQGHIPLKLLDFEGGVNITLGCRLSGRRSIMVRRLTSQDVVSHPPTASSVRWSMRTNWRLKAPWRQRSLGARENLAVKRT